MKVSRFLDTKRPDSYFTTLPSPLGEILLAGDGEALTRLSFEAADGTHDVPDGSVRDEGAFRTVVRELEAYSGGGLHSFSAQLAPGGTAFERQVWEHLKEIPWGTTESYGDVASAIGHRGAAWAVGLANGRNPIAIIVPCHRVVGRDGSLTGYGGGIGRKRWLLDHERGLFSMPLRP